MTRLLMCAGESSGDQLAAAVLPNLRDACPGLEVRGLAGPAMRAAGVHPVARTEDVRALGLVEVLEQVPRIRRVLKRLEDEARAWRPDLVLTIDSPSLLLRFGRRAKAEGLPVVHWVSPQIWAWRPGRAATLHEKCDTVLCLFPFEVELYREHPVEAVFTGHPRVEALLAAPPPPPSRRPTFGLAPGSRPSEIERLWPTLRQVGELLRTRHPGCELVVPVAPGLSRRDLPGLDATFVDGLAPADAYVVASGTATLELAAMGIPMVVIYRVSRSTWALGRRLVRGVSHVALPNVLAGRQVVPEHLQHLDASALAAEAEALLGSAGVQQRAALAELVRDLRAEGALERAANAILDRLP